MRRLLLILLVLSRSALADPPAAQPTTQPYRYDLEIRENPPMRLHVVTIDLTRADLSIRVVPGGPDPDGKGPWQTTLLPVRAIAEREGFDLAINGGFFSVQKQAQLFDHTIKYPLGAWAQCVGRVMTDGQLWAPGPAKANLAVSADGTVQIGTFQLLPPNTRQLIGGKPQIVYLGRAFNDDRQRNPRTAIGIDETGQRLTILVVDGRREGYSVGMTLGELAEEFLRRGCHHALNLDGGGSTTLVQKAPDGYQVLNRPSDGSTLEVPLSLERPVANAIGFTFDNPPTTAPIP